MGIDLTGIVTPGGAKAKAELLSDTVRFAGNIKQEVPFEEITAEARGTLLCLSFRGLQVELGAGAKAGALAAQIRSPRPRLDRLGVELGMTAACAGPVEADFKRQLETRVVLATGTPKNPVNLLVVAAEPGPAGMLANLGKLVPFVAPEGLVLIVVRDGQPDTAPAKVQAAAKAASLKELAPTPYGPTHTAYRFQRPA